MTNKQPFDPWWYYEMGKDAAKHPNREVSNGAFAVVVICFIISLVLVGGAIALLVWFLPRNSSFRYLLTY